MKRFLLSFFAFTALISFTFTEDVKAVENDTISTENQKVTKSRLTIGIYGTGLIDAIPDDSLKAQYQKEFNDGYMQNGINPGMWAGNDWAPTGLYGNTDLPKRYTYALTRGPLQDAPGANAIWNITNVTHRTKMGHYMTAAYAQTASQDPDVQAEFYNYFPEYNLTGNV